MMAAAGRNRSTFAIVVSVIVIAAVVAIGAVVVWMNNTAREPVAAPAAGTINQETGAITVGDSGKTLDIYADFMCPFCGNFEKSWGDDMAEAVESGDLTLAIYPVGLLDSQSQGTEYSTRAANALYCVTEEDADAAYPYYNRLFEKQPREGTPGLDDEELISIAKDVGVESDAFESCVTERSHADFVAQVSDALPENPQTGGRGTPSVLLEGEWLNWQLPADEELFPRL
ncbi:DsbA family protein [Microbacterium sp. gxy059]|uniref:DsbA family protein n=1 Tax=Microbacterium sp. gxy059 TaxID=2957199 RepID=UPI003D995873